jgi:hypothetical protein
MRDMDIMMQLRNERTGLQGHTGADEASEVAGLKRISLVFLIVHHLVLFSRPQHEELCCGIALKTPTSKNGVLVVKGGDGGRNEQRGLNVHPRGSRSFWETADVRMMRMVVHGRYHCKTDAETR